MPLTTMPSTLSVGPSTSDVCYSQFLRRHDSEIDTLIRAQRERIRAGLEETGKRRCRETVSAAGRRMARKEAELETARRINSELESKMEEVAAQARIWSNHAKNTEASALGLRAALDRLLRRVPPEDAGSCCHDENITRTGKNLCRACRERDVSVLLLPCRHLCLCRVCEPEVDACPICNARKSGGLQVLMG